VPAWLGEGLVLLAVGGALLAWTWRTWPDVLVDFGRELYVPWQLATGKRLYLDVPYAWGPLSPYFNALLFRTFGVGLMTLALANVVLIGVVTAILYHLLAVIGDRFSATVACLTYLALFAFAQFVETGNYNFVTPYAHPVTHGLVLSLIGIGAVGAYVQSSRPRWIAVAGLALGGVFLTKAEVFAAAAAAILGGLLVAAWVERWPARRALGVLAALAVGALAPVVAAGLVLLWALPLAAALRGLGGVWFTYLRADASLRMPYYQAGLGADDTAGSVVRMLRATGVLALMLGLPALAAAGVRRREHRIPVALAVFALTAGVLAVQWRRLDWFALARPLPLFVLGSGLASLHDAAQARRAGDRAEVIAVRCALHGLALVLLGKIALNARLYHYGFALALPATMLAVVALLCWGPRQIERRGGAGVVARAGALAALGAVAAFYLTVTGYYVATKTATIGTGRDALRTDGLRGPAIARVLAELRSRDVAHRTLAVLPEGLMVNYLLRSQTPVPFQAMLEPAAEAWLLPQLRARPPDLLVLVHRNTKEYGFRFLGRDYGRDFVRWMGGHYRLTSVYGEPPFQDRTRFGAAVLERSTPP
jgi:hypothetical protein